MKKLMVAALAAAAVLGASEEAAAQGVLPFAVEVRGGYGIPTGEWNDDDGVDDGLGFGANVQLAVGPMLSVYAGWERYSFDLASEDGGEGEGDFEADANDSGFRAGAQFNAPLAGFTGVSPFLFGGVIYNQTEFEIGEGNASLSVESDASLGYEVGGGIGIQLAPMFTLTPAVRYRTHSAEFEDVEGFGETTVSYLSIDVGLKISL